MNDLVDWSVAARVAAIAAGESPPKPAPEALRRATQESAAAVERYTGLRPEAPLPRAEWVDRREWAAINLESMRGAVGALEQRLGAGDRAARGR